MEQHFRIPSPREGLTLFLRYLPPGRPTSKAVLYVHGATFPSASSIAHRLDGRAWQDMNQPAQDHPALGRAPEASAQIERTVQFITAQHGIERVSIVAHSWGTMAACLFASQHPDAVERLVLFGPVARREGEASSARLPAWRDITLQQQWDRFIEDVPPGVSPPFSRKDFDEWGSLYLDSDPGSRERSPTSVRVPNGPVADLLAAWAGELAYEPRLVRAPVAIVRGEWDGVSKDADAAWLLASLGSPIKRDVKIARATHLMHLENERHQLYRETLAFLA